MRPRVTVYIPCHNYGHFIEQAIESVLKQSYDNWELIIVDDGSIDDTSAIAERYASAHPDMIRKLSHSPARGLRASANLALDAARGEYIMRLDADDYLDDSALLVLATYLDSNPEVGLVYPNYAFVDEQGSVLAVEHRKKIDEEVYLLDLPAHGACTMVRKRVLKSIGGYNESYSAQDGHELWYKALNRFQIANVSTLLWYYRQHDDSMSSDRQRILDARERIKRDLVEQKSGHLKPRIAAFIPAKNTYKHLPDIVLTEVASRPLLDYALDAARHVDGIETIIVTTDDPRVVGYCDKFDDVTAFSRPAELSGGNVTQSQVLHHAVMQLEQGYGIYPDIIVLLSVHSPLRRPQHIRMALDTLLLHNVDSVISVYEDFDLHFIHGRNGLEPLNRGMIRKVRLEREALYVDNGAIRALWRDVLKEQDMLGKTVGHAVMPMNESLQIKTPFDLWMIDQIIIRSQEISPHPSEHVSAQTD